ncbi:unnamed protein product [Leptosia nina]|uniref:Regulatory protein zeste n=1 Tax=Leptosia nina TaxID=320188 RepID=A0AAV1JLW8_9NEOP
MSGWSEDITLCFLEAYQNEPCIWTSKDINHKNRQKVNDAWTRIGVILNKNVKELKIKKEILMATFRRHFKTKQDSIRSGAGADDIYKPIWLAYDLMESFLGPVYTSTNNINTERVRASNFRKAETRLLTELVTKYKYIIENKKTDAVTNKDKEAAWGKIASSFNATTSGTATRSSKTLKLKYEAIKKATKKQMSCHRQELYRTGGGPSNAPDFDDVEETQQLLALRMVKRTPLKRRFYKKPTSILVIDSSGILLQHLKSF